MRPSSAGWGGGGTRDLFSKPSSGATDVQLVLDSPLSLTTTDWSEDGRFILYQSINPDTGMDLWVLPMNDESEPFAYLQSTADERHGQFCPDGRWIAYTSDESGENR